MARKSGPRWRYGAALGAMLASLAILAAAGLATYGLSSLSDARSESASVARTVRELTRDTLRFTSAVGYGGFIHNFKNAILRPAERSFYHGAEEDYNHALIILGRIEENAARLGVATPFHGLRDALGTYRLQLYVIRRLRAKGLTPEEIDDAVRTSDADALAQLDWLLALAERKLLTREHETERLERLLGLGAAGLALIIVAALFLLWRFSTVARQRAALEEAVHERTALIEEQKMQLELALDREKELNGLHRQFVSLVSHEFRTPLAIMDGKAQQMIRRADRMSPDDVRARASVITRSVKRLIDLIECVLAAARLDDGKIAFSPVETDLCEALSEATAAASEIFPDRRIDLCAEPSLRTSVCDPVLMRQVVSNLLSNAGKYTDPGDTIAIDARRDPDHHKIRIAVRDSGVGIPADELDRLFDRFFRASTGVGRPGTGIGLHIVQSFVELHGGHIELESEEGVGTTFTVVIPDAIEPMTEAA